MHALLIFSLLFLHLVDLAMKHNYESSFLKIISMYKTIIHNEYKVCIGIWIFFLNMKLAIHMLEDEASKMNQYDSNIFTNIDFNEA